MTEHPESDVCWAVAINNSKEPVAPVFEVKPAWQIEGNDNAEIKPFTAKLIKLVRK